MRRVEGTWAGWRVHGQGGGYIGRVEGTWAGWRVHGQGARRGKGISMCVHVRVNPSCVNVHNLFTRISHIYKPFCMHIVPMLNLRPRAA